MFCQACAKSAGLPIVHRQRSRLLRIPAIARWYASSTAIQITDPILLYENLVRSGRIQQDEQQLRLLYQLRKVHDTLMDYKPSYSLRYLLESARPETASVTGGDDGSNSIARQSILPSKATKSLVQALTHEDDLSNLDTPEGFLLTGSVGTGKTMLLDLFYDSLPIKKKRIHYHAFLLGLYRQVFVALEEQRIAADNEEREMQSLAGLDGRGYPWSRKEENKAKALTRGWRQVFAGGRSYDDPSLIKEFVLAKIALDLINEATVLAFDEVQLVDIAGAGILRRVLTWYWRMGGVVIGTSNRLPSDLYQQGIQQEQFQSFLGHLQARCPVYELRSKEDWRRRQRKSVMDTSGHQDPSLPAWTRAFGHDASWYTDKTQFEDLVANAAGEAGTARQLTVYGRPVHVPWQIDGQVARFRFADLCEQALGPADYLTITSHYPTIAISDIPQLKLTSKNEARRFITFLDAAYESRTRLICHAASLPDEIFFPDAAKALAAQERGEDNPLAHDMIGEVMQDLEAPFRPNISSYTATSVRDDLEASAMKDAQTTSPAFRNLSIFTGQDEQFAYKRALSRIFELTSKEFIQSAVHAPIPAEARVWEHNAPLFTSSGRVSSPSYQAATDNGSSADITPETTPDPNSRKANLEPSESTIPRGTKVDPLKLDIDVADLPKPRISSNHIWGMIDTWGKKAGRWGMGVEAKKLERKTRLEMMREEEEEKQKRNDA